MTDNDCNKCGNCCRYYPCALHPDDLPKIAKFLHLTEKQTIEKYLIWDYYVLDNGRGYYLCPKRKGDDTNYASKDWADAHQRGCIFLTKENLCQIHSVKPKCGRERGCNIPLEENEKGYSKDIAWKDWDQTEIIKQYFDWEESFNVSPPSKLFLKPKQKAITFF